MDPVILLRHGADSSFDPGVHPRRVGFRVGGREVLPGVAYLRDVTLAIRLDARDAGQHDRAGRVVPPVDEADLSALLEKHPEIGFVGETVPALPGVLVETLGQVDDLHLVRLTRRPRADAGAQ